MEITVFPPHGFVRLVNHVGTELDVVNAARVSFHKESEWDWQEQGPPRLSEQDAGLVRFLLKNRHGTPFEQGFMAQFHIRLPIFVMREWVRHRIGHSVNEESGRYVELRPDFYIPENVRTQVGRPGAYRYEPLEEQNASWVRDQIKANGTKAYERYQLLLAMDVAKEQARLVLPLNLYTEIRWTVNARSLMHFLGLRSQPDAMFEIRKYAEALETIFAQFMPVTYKAFIENGKVAP